MDGQSTVLESWHLDKRVNISIITALLFQAAIGVWQVAKMDSRLLGVEEKVTHLQRRDDSTRTALESVSGDVREIKTIVKMLRDTEKK
jgi:hypothetical protein